MVNPGEKKVEQNKTLATPTENITSLHANVKYVTDFT